MGKSIEKRDVGNYRIKIYPDTEPCNPRNDDNLGKMICFRKTSSLGDKHDYVHGDYSSWDEMEQAILRNEKGGVIIPLFVLEHGGMTMSTSSFNDPWDSGQVGFIIATNPAIRENWGIKNVTKKWREQAKKIILAEVEEYDQYLTGDVFGYKIFNLKKNGKKGDEVDCVWNFFGRECCMDEAVSLARGFTIADEIDV